MARGGDAGPSTQQAQQTQADRRRLREGYRKLKDKATAEKDELLRPETQKLQAALLEADALHKEVRKPREQKADADLLAQLTEFTLQAAKQLRPDASLCTPTAFLGRLMTHFVGGMDMEEEEEVSPERFQWQAAGLMIGLPLLTSAPGVTCMLGPLDSQPKIRKQPQQRVKRKRPEEQTNPEEIVEQSKEGKEKETDANMTTMFNIMCRHPGGIPMERLLLNKKSYSQTVENLFSLSFLIKDGRAALRKMEDGSVLVEPRNPPGKDELGSGKAETTQFITRLDYRDWLTLKEDCTGSDYMPNRKGADMPPQPPRNGTPVRKGQGKFRPRSNSYSHQRVEEESEEEAEEALVVNRRGKKKRS